MRQLILILGLVALIGLLGTALLWGRQSQSANIAVKTAVTSSLATAGSAKTANSPFTLTSSAFADNGEIPRKYTCQGQNVNPPLTLTGVPVDTKSLALTVTDPDAMGTWTHWVVWNIPAETYELAGGKLPRGVNEGLTSFQKPGYGGPCPPAGEHRYLFKLYALDNLLNLPATAMKTDLEDAMKGHIVSETQLLGRYQKQ